MDKRKVITLSTFALFGLSIYGCSQAPHTRIETILRESEKQEREGNFRKSNLLREKAIEEAWIFYNEENRDYTELGLVNLILSDFYERAGYTEATNLYRERAREFLKYARQDSEEDASFKERLVRFLKENFSRLIPTGSERYRTLENKIEEILRTN